jgi:hypothetical protein
MKKLLVAVVPLLIQIEAVDINQDSWNLMGTPYDTIIQNLNLNANDFIWTYDNNGTWGCYQEEVNLQGQCNVISQISGGSGFWLKSSKQSINYQTAAVQSKILKNGWNLVGFGDNTPSSIQLSYNTSSYKSIWTYINGSWFLYTPQGDKLEGINQLENIQAYHGAWIHYLENPISIGTASTNLSNGVFDTITHSSSSNLENIWNISFPIDATKNYSNVEIAIKYEKYEDDGSPDVGELIIMLPSITNGVLATPTWIQIMAIGDSSNYINSFSSNYKPEVLTKALSLSNGNLSVNLGTLFGEDSETEDYVTQQTKYKLTITSNSLSIPNSKSITLTNLTDYNRNYIEKDGIEGYINID